MPCATSMRKPSTPRSSQNRRTSSNSARTSGCSQSRSGWRESNRCRYHSPGVPSGSVVRVHAGPPKIDCQLFGGSVPSTPRPVAEQVAGALGRARAGGQRGLEPDVLVGGVVGHQVDDHAQAEAVRALEHRVEVGERAEQRVDVAVVGHVVAGVGLRGPVERREPHGVDAELGQVVQARGHAGQVADAVAGRVGERARVDLVDHGIPPPLAVGRAGGVHQGAQGSGVGRRHAGMPHFGVSQKGEAPLPERARPWGPAVRIRVRRAPRGSQRPRSAPVRRRWSRGR